MFWVDIFMFYSVWCQFPLSEFGRLILRHYAPLTESFIKRKLIQDWVYKAS